MKPTPPPIDFEELLRRAEKGPPSQPTQSADKRNNRRTRLLRRWVALGLGAVLLAWLPFEDTGVAWPLLFAGIIVLLAVERFLRPVDPARRAGFVLHLFAGLLGGAALPLVAVLLMALKSGAHGHPTPDFTPEQVSSVLSGIPAFALGGLLMGLGAAMWRKFQ